MGADSGMRTPIGVRKLFSIGLSDVSATSGISDKQLKKLVHNAFLML